MTFWTDRLWIIYGVRTIIVYELIQDLPYIDLIYHMVTYIIIMYYTHNMAVNGHPTTVPVLLIGMHWNS